jgi:MFS family permease
MSDVGWAALLTDVTTPEVRGRVIGTLNFIASLARMVGILFAGSLYNNGQGFENGTIFYIVTGMLFIGAGMMAWMSRHIKTRETTPTQKETCQDNGLPKGLTHHSERSYHWFLAALIVIVLGAASINQIFLLFIKLPTSGAGLNASDPEMSLILSAWTIGGMIASIATGRLADKIGRIKVMFLGLILATATPLLYMMATTVPLMALIYGVNGVSFWTIQTVGFVLAGDIIPQHRRGRLLSRYNTVMALSWGPAGVLIGGPLADFQVNNLGLSPHTAYVNTFYVSSAMLICGMVLFALKVTTDGHGNNA